MSSRWFKQAHACARLGDPFPIYGVSNLEIAELLHEFAHGTQSGEVRMLFEDGSQSPPFPGGCLRQPTGTQHLWKEGLRRLLQVGLFSRRHPLMDFAVDLYLLRNAEFKGESHAVVEERACLAARRLLNEAGQAAGANGVLLDLYQTGWEPAVVGFWRGACETLRDNPNLRVLARPRLKRRNVLVDVDDASRAESEKLCSTYPDFFGLESRWNARQVGQSRPSLQEVEEPLARTVWSAGDIDALDDPTESDGMDEEAPSSTTGPGMLRWLSELPMRSDERDAAVERFPALQSMIIQLYEDSQYSCGSEWGR